MVTATTKQPSYSNNISNDINTTVVSAEWIKVPNENMCPVTKDKSFEINKTVPVQPRKPNPNAIKTTPPVRKKVGYQYQFKKAQTDKRVSLNVAPLQFDKNGGFNPASEPFAKRIQYVLGSGKKSLKSGQTVYGFLNSCLSKSCGLIFPYTPNITITHPVNYDSTDITHSNLRMHHYKNTPPPSYSLEATFTADNRENALHMLSAIWFLRAVTKCDFGEQANTMNDTAGMPPPILYLNGYNQVMDNIPVIVKSFSYTLPKDKDYVALGINLDTSSLAYNDRKLYSSVDGNFYDNYDGSASGSEGMKYINGIANSIKSLQSDTTTLTSNRYNNYYFNNWLPTEMTFSIQLEVQPNLLKYKKQFNLDYYKMGIYNLDAYKGGVSVYIPTKEGVQDCTNQEMSDALQLIVLNKVNEYNLIEKFGWSQKYYQKYVSSEAYKNAAIKDGVKEFGNNYVTTVTKTDGTAYDVVKQTITLSKDEVEKIESGMGFNSKPTSYKFDRSGFTW